ncbi:MAG: ribonuclease Z [Methanomassiliicoccaceae archaeon]|nr:ribonuclease Z [Methanomassiliicoccaceae archaeon]
MVDILFAGTGASVPSRERSLPCVAVRIGKEIVLFDCGEGSQRQLMISPFSFMKIKAIFVSHLHGDHFLGIPGLLQTMDMSGRKDGILLVGPKGFGDVIKRLTETCGSVTYNVNITEASDGDEFEFKEFAVKVFEVKHSVTALGFLFEENERPGKFDRSKAVSFGIKPGPDFTRLQNGEEVNGVRSCDIIGPARKGRRIVYSGDTVKCIRVKEMAENADVLIHEATYMSKDSALAGEHMHSTAHDAASTAKDANVSVLLVTHMSNRYEDMSEIEEECRKVFPNTLLAKDLMLFTVK